MTTVDHGVEISRFHSGDWYRIVTVIPGVQRKPRVMHAQYLGWNKYLEEHEFNLRPAAGTTAVRPRHIVDSRPLDADEARPMVPRVVKA